MTRSLFLTILVLGELPGFYCKVTTVGDQSVLEGRSITVPCHYNPQYISNVKYWCVGQTRAFCSSLARTDDPESAPQSKGRVTIADDPTQHVFTVSMRELTEADSGWYWCGVELGGMWVSDSAASLYISVVQGLSVVNTMLSADEGSSVSVQCLYSKNLRSVEKRWCRSGSWSSCSVTDSDGTFSNKNILIQDDGSGAFSVTLQRLEMRDAGWYWCGAGQQHVSVHISVTKQTTTPATVSHSLKTTGNPSVLSSEDSSSGLSWEFLLVICVVVLLVIVVFLALCKLWQLCKKKQKHRGRNEMNDSLTMCPWREGECKNTSVIFLNTPAQQVQML